MSTARARAVKAVWAADAQVKAISYLRSQLSQMTDDEEVIRDTIEGETAVDAIVEELLAHRQILLADVAKNRALADEYNGRSAHLRGAVEKIEGMIREAMLAAGQKTLPTFEGTCSLRDGSYSVEVIEGEEHLIPLQFKKAVVDKSALSAALKDAAAKIAAMEEALLVERANNGDTTLACQLEHSIALLREEIPGARLVRGEPSLSIIKPRSAKKGAAQ